LGALAEIVRVLGEPKGFVEKCGEMLAILAREVGADLATLREPDSSFTSMNLIAEYKSEESTDVDLPFSVPLRSIFETEAKPFGVGDYSKWPSPVQAYLKNGPRAGMVAPIYHDGVLTGFLGFGSRDLNKFDEQSANLLSTISDIVGVLIQNARLLELREIESDMGRILRSPLELSAVFESFSVEVKKVINFD